MPASASRSAMVWRVACACSCWPRGRGEQVARVGGPDEQGGDLALLGRGEEFHLFEVIGHFEVSMPGLAALR